MRLRLSRRVEFAAEYITVEDRIRSRDGGCLRSLIGAIWLPVRYPSLMRQLSRLRTLVSSKNEEGFNDSRDNAKPPPEPQSGNASSSGGKQFTLSPPPKKNMRATKRSLLQEHKSEDDERGCVEAVTAFLAAIGRAHDVAGKQNSSEGGPRALLQTSKGSGMIACRDSARELLHVFGHAPLVHLEGVIWVKTSGQRGDRGS